MTTHEPRIDWVLERAAAQYADGEATIDLGTGERWSWRQTAERVSGVATGLRDLGLDVGDRVGVLALNSARHFELWFAIPEAGLVMNDLNYRLAVEELAFIADDSNLRVLFVDDNFLDVGRQLFERCADLQTLVHLGPGSAPPDGTLAYDGLAATTPRALDDVGSGGDGLAAIFYTGGTTGLPKGAMLSHRNLTANALHMAATMKLDEGGYLYIVDRAKDMIISGGENIYTTEVENAVYSHPSVLEAAVFGVPHVEWGETVHVEVVTKPGASLSSDELVAHCRSLIAGYKLPRSIKLRGAEDPLPKSGAGKILKRDLRSPYWEGRDRGVNERPREVPMGNSVFDSNDGLGLARLVADGDVSPTELLDEAIERTEAADQRLNVLAARDYDYARAAIARGLPDGPFRGVPFLRKDEGCEIEGLVTTMGLAVLAERRASGTSTLARRYLDAGLVIFGATIVPPFCVTIDSDRAPYGPARNPWDLSRTPGGSSSGSAAVVGAGVLPMAHGNDGGGSQRDRPACNVGAAVAEPGRPADRDDVRGPLWRRGHTVLPGGAARKGPAMGRSAADLGIVNPNADLARAPRSGR